MIKKLQQWREEKSSSDFYLNNAALESWLFGANFCGEF